MNLPTDQRKKLIQLQKEISELEQKGEANINEDKSTLEFTVEELKGIPEDTMAKLPKPDGKPNSRIIALDKKVGGPAMSKIDSDETRKKLNFALDNVGKQNIPIMNELAKKRHE
jgi:Zn-dependent oligopeptidase